MKSLSDLTELVTPMPSTFASEGDTVSHVFQKTATDATCLSTGFPKKYAVQRGTTSGGVTGEDLVRDDFNKLGDLATRELHFRQAGGVHTFNAAVSSSFAGYPKGVVLAYDDGVTLKSVESSASRNANDFTSDPTYVDNFRTDAYSPSGSSPSVLWRGCSRQYGIDEDLFRANVDFSVRNSLGEDETLAEDSLVVVSYKALGNRTRKTDTTKLSNANQMRTMEATVTLTDTTVTPNATMTVNVPNRGKHGYKDVYTGESIFNIFYFVDIYSTDPVCGCGNYVFATFAKKGWKVKCEVHLNETDGSSESETKKVADGVCVYAYAVRTSIGEQE